MKVQTAVASAKEAEQRAISVAKEGKSGNGVTQMMEIMAAKATRDLQIDIKAQK